MLARIEGAPPGSKGLSLFIVPKYWVGKDGSPEEFNDVVCTGIEEKMGSHGICVKAIQIYSGYGYTRDFPAELLARDVKITSIYEGADGIQAMDLIGRKLPMSKGVVFQTFIKEMRDAVDRAAAIDPLEPLARDVEEAITRLETVARHILEIMGSTLVKVAFADSVPFLMVMGDLIIAWMLIWRATIASEKLQKKSKGKDQAFY